MKNPTKQTVYLPVKVKDASGNCVPDKQVLIVKEQGELDKYWDALVKPQEGYFLTSEELNEYTQGVIKQALETAAEKAKFRYTRILVDDPKEGEDAYMEFPKVDKQSITNTFEETFKRFKK